MPSYSMPAKQTSVSTGAKSMWTIGAATGATTLRRFKIFEFGISIHATPADNAIRVQIGRTTAAGTTTASPVGTPLNGDTAVAALATLGWNHTAEPTYTAGATLFDQSFNQRASYRWVAAPGKEYETPAVNAAGIGCTVLSPAFSGDGAYGPVMWEE
jgi:hypothetical protein